MKSLVSVCQKAKADGTKLKHFIVFPGGKQETKQLNEEFSYKFHVASSANGWMNEDLTLYIVGARGFGKVRLQSSVAGLGLI